jgi:hypothetical protein
MNIAIISDSRAFLGAQPTWPYILINIDKQNKYTIFPRKTRLYSVFEQVDDLKQFSKTNKVDIAIFQTAYHEYICPWSIKVHQSMLGKYDPTFDKFLKPVVGGKFVGRFHYRNIELIKNTLSQINNYCKHSLYIYVPYNLDDLLLATLEANKFYSLYFTSSIVLSTDKSFVPTYTMNAETDKIHYNQIGAKLISGLVHNYIKGI